MSAFADFMHDVVRWLPYHDEGQVRSAHELIDKAEVELGLATPPTDAPNDAPDDTGKSA